MATNLTRTITQQAYAKVNLCLSVQYPPVGGYHRLDSVFQTLDLHDTLKFTACAQVDAFSGAVTQLGTPIELDCGPVSIPVQQNLVFRAIDLVEQAFGWQMVFPGQMLKIEVEKHIPAGGGLGGGSADAAAALRAFCRLHNLNPLGEKVLRVARGLGADVAFFLYGGAALMGGRGDELVRCLPEFSLPLVLMGDGVGNSTPDVYRAFDANPPAAPDAYALAAAMEDPTSSPRLLASLCSNNLEPAALEVGPQIRSRLELARTSPDVLRALVTGSGSTSYAVCPDLLAAQRFAREVASSCAWVEVARASVGQ